MLLVSVGLADRRGLRSLVIPQRWDRSGSQAAPPGKSCAVTNIGITSLPSWTICALTAQQALGTSRQKMTEQPAGWEEEADRKLCGDTEAQVAS